MSGSTSDKQKKFNGLSEKRALKYFDKAEDLSKKLKSEYEGALSDIQKQIADFYMRYAVNNSISYKDAVQALNQVEVKNLYNELDKLMSQVEIDDPELKKDLEALSLKKRINRLEALMAKIKIQSCSLENWQQDNITSFLQGVCNDNHSDTLSDLKEILDIKTSFAVLNPKLIEEVIKYPWSGEMFSDRIWNNRKKLVRTLNQELTQGFVQGKSVQGMANTIAKKMDSSYKDALAVVRTETSYVVNKSTILAYEDSGVIEEFQLLAVLDGDTSRICLALNLEVYKLSDAKVGVNVPPFHPNCRTVVVPYFED